MASAETYDNQSNQSPTVGTAKGSTEVIWLVRQPFPPSSNRSLVSQPPTSDESQANPAYNALNETRYSSSDNPNLPAV
ncbi:hypothetical protein M0802_010345 [Mischocyttarus mexicanus]|nr:hypothetical protein M0802_010345 [Mischocyttarus mexicanus]